MILTEMETHEDAWPFLLAVNLKLVPGYKKVIIEVSSNALLITKKFSLVDYRRFYFQ